MKRSWKVFAANVRTVGVTVDINVPMLVIFGDVVFFFDIRSTVAADVIPVRSLARV